MSKILTADEVKRHNTRKSVWMVIRNEVYDVTSFVDEVSEQNHFVLYKLVSYSLSTRFN